MLIANDATVKAGAFFRIGGPLRGHSSENIALVNRLPVASALGRDLRVSSSPSAGGRLPGRGRFRPHLPQQRRHFAVGIAQIAAIMGNCVAGAVTCPLCATDSDDRRLGPVPGRAALVKARSGSKSRTKSWGARRCTPRSAARSISTRPTTNPASNAFAPSSTKWVRQILRYWPALTCTNRSIPPKNSMAFSPGIPRNNLANVAEIIARIVMHPSALEQRYRAEYGETLLCGYAPHRWMGRGHHRQPEGTSPPMPRTPTKNASGQLGGVIVARRYQRKGLSLHHQLPTRTAFR